MERTIKVLNQMVKDGVVPRYAIGGAVGAFFYIEPVDTHDIDVYVDFPKDQVIVTLNPIYDYLKAKGYRTKDVWIIIEGNPVQFLPAADPLSEEAVSRAAKKKYGKATARVFSPEHVVAMSVALARPDKDIPRIAQFVEEGKFNQKKLADILKRHGLFQKWKAILRRLDV